MYGYKCEYCTGIVREKIVAQEAFKYKKGFVILENVPIGVCDKCGNRYYSAEILHKVEDVASGKCVPDRNELIPVTHVG
ncbi:MAG: YgiT-type zinc finger protein [Candidatus Schekmanbacteria bacterium]|nr:YgiT-type zinc finger protein [Candidatus Schekmanbacteria bacterium]